jgi:hypothetical protein
MSARPTMVWSVVLLTSGIVDEEPLVGVMAAQYCLRVRFGGCVGVEPVVVAGALGADTLLSFEESRGLLSVGDGVVVQGYVCLLCCCCPCWGGGWCWWVGCL